MKKNGQKSTTEPINPFLSSAGPDNASPLFAIVESQQLEYLLALVVLPPCETSHFTAGERMAHRRAWHEGPSA
jgi:hypothetical protein